MSEWRTTTFDKLIEEGVLQIGDGYRAKNSELGGTGPIFLRAGHLTDNGFDFHGVDRFRSAWNPTLQAKGSNAGDTVITTKGNSTGRVGYVGHLDPEFVYSPHLSFWRSLDHSKLAPGFIRAWSKSSEFLDQLAGLSTSTDMAPYLSLRDQRSLEISLADGATQHSIAAILGALDDKIELNRRMNRTLEAMASALFKSWFVDFDPVVAKSEGRKPFGLSADVAKLFPSRFVESELGAIPEGWRAGNFGNLARVAREHVDPRSLDPETPYVALEHMGRRELTISTWARADAAMSNKSAFKKGQILFGKLRPYFHKVATAPFAGVCSTDILVLEALIPGYRGLVLGHASSAAFVDHATAGSDGTRMPRASWGHLKEFEIAVPPQDVAETFSALLDRSIEALNRNVAESRTLAALRDTLLPKLLSGELELKHAERVVAEVA